MQWKDIMECHGHIIPCEYSGLVSAQCSCFKLFFLHFSWQKSRVPQILTNPRCLWLHYIIYPDKFCKVFQYIYIVKHWWTVASIRTNSCILRCTKNEVFVTDFFSKCDQICRFLWILSCYLKSRNDKIHFLSTGTVGNSWNNYFI